MKCLQHPFTYEDDCGPCLAEAYLNGNLSVVRDAITVSPEPALLVLNLINELSAGNDPVIEAHIDALIRLLDT